MCCHRARVRSLLPCKTWVGTLLGLSVLGAIASSSSVRKPVRGIQIVYVDAAAADGHNNGTSWEDAYIHLQDALAEASGDLSVGFIWVAAGTYTPDLGAGQTVGDRDATFALVPDVKLYGGFAGGDTSLIERDAEANPTILSGDLNADDGPGFANNDENSRHVMNAGDATTATVVDGFVITGGNADHFTPPLGDRGGAVLINGGSPTFIHCTFESNFAKADGGAIYVSGGQPTLANCNFRRNQGPVPGGSRSPRTGGGAVYSAWGSDITIVDCDFAYNAARYGGAFLTRQGTAELANCTFSENLAAVGGGGVYSMEGNTTLTRCTFTDNSIVFGVNTGAGGGMYDSGHSLTLTSCKFIGNSAGAGGGLYNRPLDASDSTITNCAFVGNSAVGSSGRGGGLYNSGFSPSMTNCSFLGNTGKIGGGAFCEQGAVVVNCTLAGNHASDSGGGMYLGDLYTTITNSILWGNTATSLGPQVWSFYRWPLYVNYSAVQGGPAGIVGPDLRWGAGNIDDDPLFVDPDGPDDDPFTWQDNNYRLSGGSPCIDAGTNGAVPPDVTTDLDGIPRILDGNDDGHAIVDMGTYEFHLDCNTNGVPDDLDIEEGTSQDCNTNNVPDECDLDSDGDGLIDDCDGCPNSDLGETIIVDGCETNVPNMMLDDGCTMSDEIAKCAVQADHHGEFVRCVARLAKSWQRDGLISGQEKGRIQRCAARSDIPTGS
ncbi:MAG: right-handed parallel beta-helix repeat-containing protein [bacterium]|nr:right-handed parallel beta-helix repeat-containing protein [bacterium]